MLPERVHGFSQEAVLAGSGIYPVLGSGEWGRIFWKELPVRWDYG